MDHCLAFSADGMDLDPTGRGGGARSPRLRADRAANRGFVGPPGSRAHSRQHARQRPRGGSSGPVRPGAGPPWADPRALGALARSPGSWHRHGSRRCSVGFDLIPAVEARARGDVVRVGLRADVALAAPKEITDEPIASMGSAAPLKPWAHVVVHVANRRESASNLAGAAASELSN